MLNLYKKNKKKTVSQIFLILRKRTNIRAKKILSSQDNINRQGVR